MDIRFDKQAFVKSLAHVQGVVERRSTMPVLANCLVEARENAVKISATDLEVAITIEQEAEVRRPGRVTVPARALFDIVRELPEKRVALQVLPNHWVEVASGKARFKLVGMQPEEFPNLPVPEKGDGGSIEAAVVMEMIEKVAAAISTDETRFNLNGVFAEMVDGVAPKLRFVATDSHRLAFAERSVTGKWKVGKGVIIPRKGIQELRRLLDGVEGEFAFHIGPKLVSASVGPVTLLIRLIDGQFPPYQQVIPKDHQRLVPVGREALRQALRRAQLIATDRARGIVLSVSSGQLRLSVSNPDVGEVEEELPIAYKGEAFRWGVNARYLADVLDVLTDEQVVLELKSEVSPCVIHSEFDRGFLAVVMPMRI